MAKLLPLEREEYIRKNPSPGSSQISYATMVQQLRAYSERLTHTNNSSSNFDIEYTQLFFPQLSTFLSLTEESPIILRKPGINTDFTKKLYAFLSYPPNQKRTLGPIKKILISAGLEKIVR